MPRSCAEEQCRPLAFANVELPGHSGLNNREIHILREIIEAEIGKLFGKCREIVWGLCGETKPLHDVRGGELRMVVPQGSY